MESHDKICKLFSSEHLRHEYEGFQSRSGCFFTRWRIYSLLWQLWKTGYRILRHDGESRWRKLIEASTKPDTPNNQRRGQKVVKYWRNLERSRMWGVIKARNDALSYDTFNKRKLLENFKEHKRGNRYRKWRCARRSTFSGKYSINSTNEIRAFIPEESSGKNLE